MRVLSLNVKAFTTRHCRACSGNPEGDSWGEGVVQIGEEKSEGVACRPPCQSLRSHPCHPAMHVSLGKI